MSGRRQVREARRAARRRAVVLAVAVAVLLAVLVTLFFVLRDPARPTPQPASLGPSGRTTSVAGTHPS